MHLPYYNYILLRSFHIMHLLVNFNNHFSAERNSGGKDEAFGSSHHFMCSCKFKKKREYAGKGYILESLNLQTSWDNRCICNKSFLVHRWSVRGHTTLLCVCVPAPEGKACCRKTAAEFGPGVSGVSACSRHKRLPTGPPSPLHKEAQKFILNEGKQRKTFSSTSHLRLLFCESTIFHTVPSSMWRCL